jgi:predicted nucleotidyltransferase
MRNDTLSAVRRWVGGSKDWLEQFLLCARSNTSIAAIVAMGSAVRERGHRRSDFDLLVLHRGKRPAIEAPIEVDVRWYTVEKVESLLAAGNEIICWAIKFGVPLLDSSGIWAELHASWADRLPLPSASEASSRGQRSLQKAREMLDAGDDAAANDLLLAAATQFVRDQLIGRGIFPASRPELPRQLLAVSHSDPLAVLLEEAMYQDDDPSELATRLEAIIGARATS